MSHELRSGLSDERLIAPRAALPVPRMVLVAIALLGSALIALALLEVWVQGVIPLPVFVRHPRLFVLALLFITGGTLLGMRRSTTRANKRLLAAAAAVSVAIMLIPFATRSLYIEYQPSSLFDKRWTLMMGAILTLVSVVLLRSPTPAPSRPNRWPTGRDVLIAAALAIVVTAVELLFSTHYGLLARPAYYDGAGYLYEAKRDYALIAAESSIRWRPGLALSNRYPVWIGLMLTNFRLLGIGEWQALAVRFWPVFLLLLLVFWVVRRGTGGPLAWAAAGFTCLLPTVSVSLHALVNRWFHLPTPNADPWYIADLRPDLLYAVLLVCAVVPLLQHVDDLDARTWMISAAAAALTILTKSAAVGIIAVGWGCAILYAFGVNRHRLTATWRTGRWALLPFILLLAPWVMFHGLELTGSYLYAVLTFERSLYSNPNPTFWSEAGYYWRWFTAHMGAMGWLMLCVGFFGLAVSWRERDQRLRAVGYLFVSLVLYLESSAMAVKNYFVGLPYYLLWWVWGWATLTYLLERRPRLRWAAWAVAATSILYAAIVVGAGGYALRHLSALDEPEFQDKVVTERLARDLRARLRDDDCFLPVPGYGYPAALQFQMLSPDGRAPEPVVPKPVDLQPADFVRRRVSRCRAVMVYEEDIGTVAQHLSVWPHTMPYYRAIAEWVRNPASGYRLAATYRLAARRDLPDGFTIEVYAR